MLEWVVEAERLGVGEIMLTSVDQEGTRKGFDLELLAAVRRIGDIERPAVARTAPAATDQEAVLDRPAVHRSTGGGQRRTHDAVARCSTIHSRQAVLASLR